MTRKLASLQKFVSDDRLGLTTFYQQFNAGEVLPENNHWDRVRQSADTSINPYYYSEIHFAALSLDEMGATWYGPFHVTLTEDLIRARSSIFEENPIQFLKRHGISGGEEPPAGYRSTWENRSLLAQAKLQSRVTSATTPPDFAGILLRQNSGPDADFLEVHIYGPLHRSAISKVVVTQAPKGPEGHIWRNVKRELVKLGVEVRDM